MVDIYNKPVSDLEGKLEQEMKAKDALQSRMTQMQASLNEVEDEKMKLSTETIRKRRRSSTRGRPRHTRGSVEVAAPPAAAPSSKAVVGEESKVIVGWEKSGRVESEVSTHLFNSFIQCWYFQISRVSDPGKVKTRRVTDPARVSDPAF
jgi:hypothetical protein